MKMNKPSIALVILLFVGCSHGPVRDKDSPLAYLNGDYYQNVVTIGAIPVAFERQGKSSVMRGVVVLEGDLLSDPLRNQVLILMDEGQKEILRTRTDSNGKFEFKGDVLKGNYLIKLDSKCYLAKFGVKVIQYETDGLVIKASRLPSCSPS